MRTSITTGISLLLAAAATAANVSIIPAPQRIEMREGTFALNAETRIVTDTSCRPAAEALAIRLRAGTGFPFSISTEPLPANGAILLTTNAAHMNGEEGYELAVTPDLVTLRAKSPAGLQHASQTLLQLLPPAVFAAQPKANVDWSIPAVQITDQPRFKWRGVMLDVSRHFFSKEEIKRLLDYMALHKLNTFHWHLTDDQGWRIEIKKHPKLTEIGAWRPGTGFGMSPKDSPAYDANGRYGGFYTQDDVRDVVAYAAARHITVVPEIEMPGHASAALAAYPQLSCTGGPFEPGLIGGVFHGIYCAGKEETFAFLDDILAEVASLFPGPYLHIGGDEVPKANWSSCPRCQARMQAEGLKNEHELQSYFIRRIEKSVNAHGRKLIGWSEILEGGLAPNAAVMDWIGGGAEAASQGHDAVMTPTSFCYFDYYQSRDTANEPFSIGGFVSLEKVYSFEPMPPQLATSLQHHILGVQGNLWTEYVPNFRQVEYMLFPRACALAETGWSARENRNWDDFKGRMQTHEERLAALGMNFRREGGLKATQKVATAPKAFGPTPSQRQLRWHELEYYGFLHFTINTFTDKEWGYGDESPQQFNPTDFDANQIARVAAESGMKALILTAKHHDGFCLWPSKFTEHSVKNSPWRNGQGDVVKEIAEACKRHGLEFGVYLSPWDRNRADYGSPEYITYYRNQIRELLTGYGPIFEIWFDGANGGDGFYGGAREKRVIDRKTYYDWPGTWKLVRELQPRTCIWSDAGLDARWVGNERGVADETCWATLNGADFAPGEADEKRLGSGDRPGTHWIPAECDVSIRPGWFYHANEDSKVRSPENLVDLYFKSVGRGANLLLNIPPDRRGLIHENDAKSLRELKQWLDTAFANDLAPKAKLTASNTRGDDSHFVPEKVLDNRRDTYWSTDDSVLTPELVVEFPEPVQFNLVRLREHLPLGQRIEAIALDQWTDGHWIEFATATSIGNCRLIRTEPVKTSKVRLRIVKAAACPAIAEFGLFWNTAGHP